MSDTNNTPAMDFDYVIVGGGSAGCVLAARLSEDPAVSVALLEAGGADTSVLIHCPAGLALMAKAGHVNWGFETVPQPGLDGRRGYQPRGKVLGGSSSVNAMVYIRGHHSDYDHWAAEGNAGWAWAKLATGVLVFEGCLVDIVGPIQEEARLSASALAGHLSPALLAGSAGGVRGSLWVMMVVATANIVLAIWRPRFTNLRD